MRRTKNSSAGFTIVEILLVLVVAAIILLIVLLAVSQLNRVKRNTIRRNAVLYVAGQMETHFINNHLKYPTDGKGGTVDNRCAFILNDLADLKPTSCTIDASKQCAFGSAGPYDVCYHDRDGAHVYLGDYDEVSIEPGHWCNVFGSSGTYPIESTAGGDDNTHAYVVWTQLEGAPVFCIDNNKND